MDYVGLHLRLCKPYPEAGLKADVTLRMINHAGGVDQVRMLPAGYIWGQHDPPRSGSAWGYVKLISRANVLDASNG